MFLYIVKWSLIYITTIYLLHNLYLFFEENITSTIYKDHNATASIEMQSINNILSNSYQSRDKSKNILNTNTINSINNKVLTITILLIILLIITILIIIEFELNEFLNTLNKI